MRSLFLYADQASQEVLACNSQKVITLGSDFGYGNFGDILQHISSLKTVKNSGRFDAISIMAANAINFRDFPSLALADYNADALIFVSEYPLILSESDPQLSLVAEIRNVAGLYLYGGGFLNTFWGDFVLNVVEYFLRRDERINYWLSGQQITPPFETRVTEHINLFRPKLLAVRDEMSLQLLIDQGLAADFSFDDATEALTDFTKRLSMRCGKGLALHLNSTNYTGTDSLEHGLSKELARISLHDSANHDVTVFQAFRDSRQEVIDTNETIKRLDRLFPFYNHRTIDLVGLLFDQSASNAAINLDLALGYSCSYHVALWLQLAGIPCWLRSTNSFYNQKSQALQVTQSLDEFLRSPKLADHSSNLERRAAWNEKLQRNITSVDSITNCLQFEMGEDGPTPWPFYYKGQPRLEEKLSEAEKNIQWQCVRAEKAECDLSEVRQENDEMHAREHALLIQLTKTGDDAHRQRARAKAAERDLSAVRQENDEMRTRLHALQRYPEQVFGSRFWRLACKFRVLRHHFLRNLGSVFRSLRKRLTRHRL
jgi:hypothetical protein